MRYIRYSPKGAQPLNIGMNRAKRLARRSDRADQLTVLKQLGPGHPRQHSHHQALVRWRHAYYRGELNHGK